MFCKKNFWLCFRLTIHTVEDLQKELERKANMAEHPPRPNSPDWRSLSTEPLIYSPRHPPQQLAPPRPKVGILYIHTQVIETY